MTDINNIDLSPVPAAPEDGLQISLMFKYCALFLGSFRTHPGSTIF